MTQRLTEEQAALFSGPNYGVVTTIRDDGSPQSTVVWIDLEDDRTPSFNTARGRIKPANLERNPRVALLVVKDGDFYTWLSLDGRVELTAEGAEEQIDKLSRKYDGKPWQYVDGQERVKARILPDRVSTYGLT